MVMEKMTQHLLDDPYIRSMPEEQDRNGMPIVHLRYYTEAV